MNNICWRHALGAWVLAALMGASSGASSALLNVGETASRGPANTVLAFNFTMTGLSASSTTVTLTTNASGFGSGGGGSPGSSLNQFTATAGQTVTITQVGPWPAGWTTGRTTTASCTDSAAPGNGNPTGALPGVTSSGNTITLPGSAVKANSALTCTTQNTRPMVQLRKTVVGTPLDGGQFNLQISGGNPQPVATNPATNVGTGGSTGLVGVDVSSTVTLTETAGAGTNLANYTSSLACTTFAGAVVPVSGSGGVYTLVAPAAGVDAGSDTTTNKLIDCILTNTANLPPTVRVAKKSVGGVGTFVFDSAGVTNQGDTITTVTSGVTVVSANVHTGTAGAGVAINEYGGIAGYDITSTCIDANSAATGNTTPISATGQVIGIPAANMKAGAQYVCIYTNTLLVPTLSTSKILNGINGAAAPAGATVQAGDVLDYHITVTNTGGAGGTTLLTETVPANTVFSAAPPSTGWSCANGAPAGTVCTQAVNSFPGTPGITTVASGTTVTSPTLHVGTVGLGMTVNEFGGIAGYSLASTCVDANSATTGNTTPITATGQLISIPNANMKPGAQYLCAFTNTRVFANLSVVQTANPATVQAGADLSFTLTVNNAGPAAANEAILRDQPGAGLSCGGVPGCTASAGAACPAAGLLTAAALASSAGVAIPVLPMGGQVVVTLACTATADGK